MIGVSMIKSFHLEWSCHSFVYLTMLHTKVIVMKSGPRNCVRTWTKNRCWYFVNREDGLSNLWRSSISCTMLMYGVSSNRNSWGSTGGLNSGMGLTYSWWWVPISVWRWWISPLLTITDGSFTLWHLPGTVCPGLR